MKFNKWFTLSEVLIVSVILSLAVVTILWLYMNMMSTRVEVQARQSLIENSYFMMERLNVLLSDFSIDYEEYFNRRVVWCYWDNYWDSFVWTWDWACNNFTHYWNRHWDWEEHKLYSCSSTDDNEGEWVFEWDADDWIWCWDNDEILWNPQSFWQYAENFIDIETIWDWEQVDMWAWPDAIAVNTWVQELYLISWDWNQRLLIRRALVGSWNYSWEWVWQEDIDRLYTLQMLRLRWFDAWEEHCFDPDCSEEWRHDWNVDTWACDYAQWFECSWDAVWWAYSWYNLPEDKDDWWVNIFSDEITVNEWNIEIFPVKKPDLARDMDDYQLSPYIRLNIDTRLYWWTWANRVNPWILSEYSLSLQSMFNTRTKY